MNSETTYKIDKLHIEVDLCTLIHETFTPEDRKHLIQSLSCAGDIITHVIDQLLSGCTEDGYSGWESSMCSTPLEKGRKRISEEYDYASARTIRDLEFKITLLEKELKHYKETHYDRYPPHRPTVNPSIP
jgi:hypothetical protein